MYQDVGIGLGSHGESNLLNRRLGRCPVAMGVSVARVLAAASSAGSGETRQIMGLLSSYNPADRGPT